MIININSRDYTNDVIGDTQAGIVACGDLDADFCYGIRILNNVVAGVASNNVDTTGFAVFSHECDDYNTIVFRNNTAHSLDGYGAIILRNISSHSQLYCMEASYFTAYKCTMAGVVSYQ